MPFVQDTFTDTNGTALASHTGETGATWAKAAGFASGAASIQDNRVYCSAGNTYYEASGIPATAEYDVEGTFYVQSNASDIDVFGRQTGSPSINQYMARFQSGSGYQLYKAVSTSFSLLGSYTGDGTTLTVGSSHTLKLELRDAAKKLYANGVERISSADNAVTGAGVVGIRASNPVNSTTGYHLDSFTATDPGGGGTTEVTATRTLLWDARQQVAPTRALSWDVRATVSASRAVSWSVRQAVAVTRQALWDVRQRVTADRPLSWDVRAVVAATRQLLWDVRQRVTATRAASWNVRAAVSATRALLWDVRQRVTATRSASWGVRALVTATRQLRWNVESLVETTQVIVTRVLAWDVRQQVSASRAASWDIRARVAASRGVVWHVRARVAAGRELRWNVRQRVVSVRSLSWRVRVAVSASRAASWSVRATVTATRILRWTVESDQLPTYGVGSATGHVLSDVGVAGASTSLVAVTGHTTGSASARGST